MEFSDLTRRALAIRDQYARLEQKRFGASWTAEELALGFVGDVGDLAKLVVARAGRRDIPDAEERLAHELADCLWSVIILAHTHQIDLERAFLQAMDELEEHLGSS